ncbi:MAG: hypothetical protein KJP21_09600 [Bacteroidia bacterium]|nr:hypothetical protein [Bacteroidia bacterium]NNJ55416.1 hypothetical protein [Bacteroidia bacterium]
MKSNLKFFTGLTCGLILGILFFNTFDLQSKSTLEMTPVVLETADEEDDPVKGQWINNSTANTLIASYQTNFIEANSLPSNTTIGGFIGKKHLRDICGISADEYIKFRFYQTADATGNSQLGIIFYPTKTANVLLRTGSASFCPMLCEYPE